MSVGVVSSEGREGWICATPLCLACRCCLLPASLHIIFPLCMSLCPHLLFYNDTCHIGLGPTLMASFLTRSPPYGPSFQIRSYSAVLGVRISTYEFGGGGRRHNSTHNSAYDKEKTAPMSWCPYVTSPVHIHKPRHHACRKEGWPNVHLWVVEFNFLFVCFLTILKLLLWMYISHIIW